MHHLDHRSPRAPAAGNVVAFSEPPFAAVCVEKLQLATPAYYRGQEDPKPEIRDRHDGVLTKDGTSWANTTIPAATVTRADLSFVSSHEPWIYWSAYYRNDRELRRLKDHFAAEYGYTTDRNRRCRRIRYLDRHRLRARSRHDSGMYSSPCWTK